MVQTLFFWGFSLLAGGACAGSLAQIIEGAKKEGEVFIKIRSSLTANSMKRLEKKIGEKFGVRLKITFSPDGSMSKAMAHLLMEYKAGISPSLDLINFSHHAVEGLKIRALERVDWKPLITPESNPEVVLTNPAYLGSIVYFTSHQGLMYNPEKISPDKVPKSFEDLADPQWKGKLGIPNATSGWTRRAFVLGKEKVYDELQGILKNGAILGRYSILHNRYQLEEIWMAFTISSYWHYALTKGMPAAWQSLDYIEVPYYVLAVTTRAKHPKIFDIFRIDIPG
jgi:iron(III) transport system substrate-binding protein